MIEKNNIPIPFLIKNGVKILKGYKGDTLVFGAGIQQEEKIPVVLVVQNYSDITSTDYEYVYVQSEGSWYILDSIGLYEKYGTKIQTVDDLLSTPGYEGKLVIYGHFEFQYISGEWVNMGEVTGSTIDLPTEIEDYICWNANSINGGNFDIHEYNGDYTDIFSIPFTGGIPTKVDDYLVFNGTQYAGVKYNSQVSPFNRDSSDNTLTIIYKARFDDMYNTNIFANRELYYNYMVRDNIFHTM